MLYAGIGSEMDEVRTAMDRVRSGTSDSERISLPSGGFLEIQRDESAPIGVRIRTRAPADGTSAPQPSQPPGMGDPQTSDVPPESDASAVDRTPGALKGNGEDARGADKAPSTPEAGIGTSEEWEAFWARAFGPTGQRPSGYPDDLPFLPHCQASVLCKRPENGFRGARNVVWARLSDPGNAVEEVKAQLRRTGWEQWKTSQATTYVGETRSTFFRKDGVQRVVSLMAFGEFSQLMLFESRGI